MKCMLRHRVERVFALLWFLTMSVSAGAAAPTVLDMDDPRVQSAMDVQDRHTDEFMQMSEVVGTATGIAEDGQPMILVFTKSPVAKETVGDQREGVPVVTMVTGEFFAMKAIGQPATPSAVTSLANTRRFSRPVPIGVSTGNRGECSAGTIGARVKSGKRVYALSNNHVYALENDAPIGSAVVQPGLYDTNCAFDPNNVIGNLSAFRRIVFSTSASNTIDAAIALSSTSLLGNATPSDGYGTPSNTVSPARLNQAVQKYGRTTALTKGAVSAVNATVIVNYGPGKNARFVRQIFVSSRGAFILPGDSGSLLVTTSGRNPVGLLFAGNSSGTLAIANPIGDVLNSFGVAIDGGGRTSSTSTSAAPIESDDQD